ncbi:hypothetical protein GCM10009647_059710 [Streptomyces sanglieri]
MITHGHCDHYGAAQELADRHGAEILAHGLDAAVIRGEEAVAAPVPLDREIPLWENGQTVPAAPPTRVYRELADGDDLGFGSEARVVHVPGHAPGSIGIHLSRHGVLFTGDTVARVDRVDAGRPERRPGADRGLLPAAGRAGAGHGLLRARRTAHRGRRRADARLSRPGRPPPD